MFHLLKKSVIIAVFGVILTVGVGAIFGQKSNDNITYRGGVVSNGYECAEIGSSILKKGGSAVDAAIATLFCEGVAMPQHTGIGGGFLMTIYSRRTKTVETLNARERAPLAATEDMFADNPSFSYEGGLSIAVPGELRGYWYAHQRYGLLPWQDFVQPTINLCRSGHRVTKHLQTIFEKYERKILGDPGLRAAFVDPKTNKPYKEGDFVKRPNLAHTLAIIAKYGADAFYDGVLTKQVVGNIRKANGILTEKDLRTYKPVWAKPVIADLPNNQTLYTMSLPGSGILLTIILNILGNFLDTTDIQKTDNWQKIVESFKYAFATRSKLGDFDIVDGIEEKGNNARYDTTFTDPKHYGATFSLGDDHGTAHISVLAPNGDAVSVTGSINRIFGSQILSEDTGIIWNDSMDDFSIPGVISSLGVPPSSGNYISPTKHPLSSMCPGVILDQYGDVILVIGAAAHKARSPIYDDINHI